jgi:3-hydroxyisobutyrate dehydrogenase-like beta-hydroxyacid dehydrogenase
MAKDMGLAVEAAKASKSPIVLGGLGMQLYHWMSGSKGYENLDFSSVYKWLKHK